MVRKPRSANLTHEQKRLICLHARQFPKTTQAQLGQWAKEQFNLNYVPSQAAMSYLLKKRAQFELVSGEGRDYKKMRTVKCPEVDAALANWFLYCQRLSLSNVKMHFVERNHAGELCVRPLEMGIVSSVKRRYRHQLLDYALDRREEGQLDIYDIPLQKVVELVTRGWQQIPRSRIMAAFASVGVQVTTESGAEIVPDNRTDDKLDAQIQALLKRLKLVSPMRLVEVVSPSAEKACDEDLTDADFADSALHVTQGSVGMQVSTADLTRHVATTVSANSSGSSTPFESRADYPGFEGSLDDSWLEWSASQRAAVRQPISDLEAVQTTIRLATEMNCDPVVMMELNRIQSEVANRDPSASSSSTQTAPSQTTARGNASICQFRFGAPTRRLL
ncbi:hypothetical protein PC116_g2630 [Phytophthora cactorum]|uniref:DDE-1 domain-containing protein n=1 Tax=Phytophthora cactorum TaxID=29920 RepID=A0A8T1ED29_9STRA|nr:hypothetical protein PC113_g5210 [Phytophthora cactorum]KAG2933896.1 hypothetical protein PC114_g1269 [Phytophthora cactorum]KAG2936814.1 hypothetical protein PC115_g4558 [Phytophthora cactorum]KAG2949489.1 hypothetical protein PC117_g5177 [Phytophthora cactorum]KAG3025451.1 hypothetical protein PC120_g6477 [Phytophthora cactorum]